MASHIVTNLHLHSQGPYIYTERVREERREGREFDIIVYSTTPHYDAQVQPPKGNSRKANSTPRSNVQHVQEAITHACALASFPGRPIPIPDVMTCTREGSVTDSKKSKVDLTGQGKKC